MRVLKFLFVGYLIAFCVTIVIYLLGCWIEDNRCAEAKYTYPEFVIRGGTFIYGTPYINNHIVRIPFWYHAKLTIQYQAQETFKKINTFIEKKINRKRKLIEGKVKIEKEIFGE